MVLQASAPRPFFLVAACLLAPAAATNYLMRLELKQALISLGAVTLRGQYASTAESARAAEYVSRLEAYASDASSPRALEGAWDLVYCDVEPFRASPFWWTLASALEDFRPGAASRVLPAHRLATRVGEVGRVRQLISLDSACTGTLTSEVDLRAGFLPGLPLGVRGTVVTTATFKADAQPSGDGARIGGLLDDADDDDTTQPAGLAADDELVLAASLVGTAVRASTLMLGYAGAGGATSTADVPLPLLDDRALPVGKLLNTVGTPGAADAAGGGGSSTDGASRTPRWRTTYMDDELRVSRDALEHFFIFVRAPSDVEQ